jgi:hypothetical protein
LQTGGGVALATFTCGFNLAAFTDYAEVQNDPDGPPSLTLVSSGGVTDEIATIGTSEDFLKLDPSDQPMLAFTNAMSGLAYVRCAYEA